MNTEQIRLEFNAKHWKEDYDCEIFQTNHTIGQKVVKIFGVNWSACGTKSIEKTEMFIKQLQEAIEVCKKLNDMKEVEE